MKITLNNLNQLKYIPKIWSTILYFIFVAVVLLLFAGRKIEELRFESLYYLFPDYYQHISNFSISAMLVLVAGYTNVLENRTLTRTYVSAALLIAANLIYELFLPFINTMDVMDAYYGIAGSIVPFIYLIPYKLYGIQVNPNYIEKNKSENPVL